MLGPLLEKLWYFIISQFVKEVTCTLYVTKAFFFCRLDVYIIKQTNPSFSTKKLYQWNI